MQPAVTTLTEPRSAAECLLPPHTEKTCIRILELLLPHRRSVDLVEAVDPVAFSAQIQQLAQFVSVGDPILFTLPGFPCKSPNPAKVLGHLPDEGERLALRFLEDLCVAVQEIYSPGARILICSDGHVFGDLIGVPDDHIDEYAHELSLMIQTEGLSRIDTFNLGDVFGDLSYDEKRRRIDNHFAPTVEHLRKGIKSNRAMMSLYLGITRFLINDTVGFVGTKSALQRQCRQRAYGVIQRSSAWGSLIARHYPRSMRLSIHPQPARSAKFGIRLLEYSDVWTTPWHACVVYGTDGTWRLMPRAQAEKVGTLVLRSGRPSHFVGMSTGRP